MPKQVVVDNYVDKIAQIKQSEATGGEQSEYEYDEEEYDEEVDNTKK